MSHKLHNPKSHAPAVYIPCWLIQISVKLLSHGAKLVYGRLSQWCNEMGVAYRSAPQLAEELGMCESSVKKFQKELRDVGLIGTYHPQAGGVNHFEFYDHPWMHEPINEQLVYKEDKRDPVYKHTLPRVSSSTTPVYDHTRINNKEIKEIKCVGENPSHTQNHSLKPKEKMEKEAFECEAMQKLFSEKFSGYKITYEELFNQCKQHFEIKRQWIDVKKWINWVKTEKVENYSTSSTTSKTPKVESPDDQMGMFTRRQWKLVSDYNEAMKYINVDPNRLNLFLKKDEQDEARKLIEQLEASKAKESPSCKKPSPQTNARRNSLTSVSNLVSHLG